MTARSSRNSSPSPPRRWSLEYVLVTLCFSKCWMAQSGAHGQSIRSPGTDVRRTKARDRRYYCPPVEPAVGGHLLVDLLSSPD